MYRKSAGSVVTFQVLFVDDILLGNVIEMMSSIKAKPASNVLMRCSITKNYAHKPREG